MTRPKPKPTIKPMDDIDHLTLMRDLRSGCGGIMFVLLALTLFFYWLGQ